MPFYAKFHQYVLVICAIVFLIPADIFAQDIDDSWSKDAAKALPRHPGLSKIGPAALTENEQKTLASIRMIDDHPTYIMTYYGDYGFEDYIKTGRPWDTSAAPVGDGCTCFTIVRPQNDKLYARNLDQMDHRPSVIVFTDSSLGYASISISSARYILAYLADPSAENIQNVLYYPYFSYDGLNEWGVSIAGLSVNGEVVYDPGKVTLNVLELRRLVLDHARSVDQAIALLRQYNNRQCSSNHMLVSDAYGNSALIEYYDGRLNVHRNLEDWQVSTNFMIRGRVPNTILDNCWRYREAQTTIASTGGVLSQQGAMDVLESVCRNFVDPPVTTEWSAIYNQTTGKVTYCIGADYEMVHEYSIPMVVDLSAEITGVKFRQTGKGNKLRVTTEVSNFSPRPSLPTDVKLYLSRKKQMTNKAILLDTIPLDTLSKNTGKVVRVNTLLPADLRLGKYYVIAVVDDSVANHDPDRSNNLVVASKKIRIRNRK